MKVRVDYEVSEEMLKDGIITALESGIGYWCTTVDTPSWPEGADLYSDIPTMGGALTITTSDGEFLLDLTSLKKGVRVMAVKCPWHFNDFIRQAGDSDTADALIQCALFGKLVYG
jgi:hypothetical protein